LLLQPPAPSARAGIMATSQKVLGRIRPSPRRRKMPGDGAGIKRDRPWPHCRNHAWVVARRPSQRVTRGPLSSGFQLKILLLRDNLASGWRALASWITNRKVL
jgi:hypothetical protein